MLIALFGAILLLLITPRWSPLVLLGIFLALWIMGSIVTTLAERISNIAQKTPFSKLRCTKKNTPRILGCLRPIWSRGFYSRNYYGWSVRK